MFQGWSASARAASKGYGEFCEVCGSTPAIRVTLRAHRGLVALAQFRKQRRVFCRTCGTAVFRLLQGDSLWQGWWSLLSTVANPVVLVANLFALRRLRALDAPVPGAPGQPLDPGPPLLRRPHILGLLVPLVAGSLLAATWIRSFQADARARDASLEASLPREAGSGIVDVAIGDCVWNTAGPIDAGGEPDLAMIPCRDSRAQAAVVGRFVDGRSDVCAVILPQGGLAFTVTVRREATPARVTVCLQRLPG